MMALMSLIILQKKSIENNPQIYLIKYIYINFTINIILFILISIILNNIDFYFILIYVKY